MICAKARKHGAAEAEFGSVISLDYESCLEVRFRLYFSCLKHPFKSSKI